MKNLKVGIGHSNCVETATRDALKGQKNPTFILTFFSSIFDPNEIYFRIRSIVGKNVPIIGNSTAGEISNVQGDCETHSIVVMSIESPFINVGVGVGKNLSHHPYQAAEEALKEAYKSLDENKRLTTMNLLQSAFIKKSTFDLLKTKLFVNVLLFDGLSAREEDFLRGLTRHLGKETVLVGGSAGDDLKFNKTYLIANGVYSDATVLMAMNTYLKVGTAMGHPYYPTYKGALVTSSKGRVVYELDGKPASEVLKDLLNVDKLTPEVFAKYTIGLKSTDIFNEYVIKSPMYASEDGSVAFYAEIPKGAFLTIMKTDEEYLIKSLRKTLHDAIRDAGSPKKIGALIIFNCILRYLLKCDYKTKDLDIIKDILGEDIPIIGFNTYGEQGRTLGGSLGHYNQTSTILLIGDELINE